jgi:ABC-type spermidine/putrescine transport system permease subunit I
LVIALCAGPVAFMVVRSFAKVDPITLDVRLEWTVDAYRALWSSLYRPVLLRSFTLSVATIALCLIVGLPAALAASRLSPTMRTAALVAVMLPSFVSFSVRVFAWQGVLAGGGPVESLTGQRLLFTPTAVLIGMTTAYVPLFFLPTFVALTRVPASLLDAAADLGASRVRQTINITLPLARGGIGAGAALVGVLSVGEFIVPTLLGGGKVLMLGTILAERGAGRDQPLAGAITATLLGAIIATTLIVSALRWALGTRRHRNV